MTNETPRQGIAPASARARPPVGRTARSAARAASHATRIAMAHRSAAQLAADLLVDRIRARAGRGWESALCPEMPQTGWLAATEHDLMAWLDAGGFAAGERALAGTQTKTAA